MGFERVGGVRLLTICLCSSFAFLIASRTAIDDPALVILTEFGVLLGLAVKELCGVRRDEEGLVGGVDRMEDTGVVARARDGLNAEGC